MFAKSLSKILLIGVTMAAIMSPALAAKHAMHTPRPCAKPQLRCIADCDKYHWCRVFACSNNKTILLPFPCGEDSGLCLLPHC